MTATGNRSRDTLHLRPIQELKVRRAVMRAISEYDLVASDSWKRLKNLPQDTVFEAADAVPEGIFETDTGKFAAAATVYVTLHYGTAGPAEPDEFPAEVTGHIIDARGESPKAVVETFDVETSSFGP